MARIARSNGKILIGDQGGFVPIGASNISTSSMKEVLRLAADSKIPNVEESTVKPLPNDKIDFCSPVDRYGKIWGIGLNYQDHATDLNEDRPNEPASFMQPSTAAVGPSGPICLPTSDKTNRITAEAELGVVIGRTCKDINNKDISDVIAGYIPIIDMTAEDILEKNPRYLTRAKSFDSFFVLGPWITTLDSVMKEDDIVVKTIVNGEVQAKNKVGNMMTKPKELIEFHSNVMTLNPGDIVSTGTPGAAVIKKGDTVTAEVQQLGSVTTPVMGPQ